MESKKSLNAKVPTVLPHAAGFSKHEVFQLLRENDGDVERTISDFEEGRAKDLLSRWEPAGTKSGKRKNKNNRNKEVHPNETPKLPVMNGDASDTEKHRRSVKNQSKPDKKHQKPTSTIKSVENDSHVVDPRTASVVLKHMLTNQTPNEAPANKYSVPADIPPLKDAVPNTTKISDNSKPQAKETVSNSSHFNDLKRARTTSENSSKPKSNQRNRKGQRNMAPNSDADKQVASNTEQMRLNAIHNRKSIEKAVRDLQRCSVSFGRYRTLLNEEFEESYKKLKLAFEELTSAAMDREVQLMRMLDNRKEDALALLSKREAKANQLKRRTDRVDAMSAQELNELRNDVKHFVSERKFEEELGKSVRFHHDMNVITNVIPNFGELSAVKNLSVGHHRERYESTASDMSSLPPPLAEHADPHRAPVEQKTSPLAAKVEPSQAPTPVPQRSTSWADSVETNPLPENRASWAIDTPLVSSTHDKIEKEQTNESKPKKNWNKNQYRRRNENNSETNPPDKNSMRNEDLPKEAPKSPGKGAGDNNFQVKRGEPRFEGGTSGRPREYDNRYRNFPPRGRGGFRGAPPRGGYFSRGGYRNDRPRSQNQYPRSEEGNRNISRDNPKTGNDSNSAPKLVSESIPKNRDVNSAPPRSPRKERDAHQLPSSFEKEESKPLPPRNNRGFRRNHPRNNETKPQNPPSNENASKPSEAKKRSNNQGAHEQE